VLSAAVEKRWIDRWVATYGEVVQTWPLDKDWDLTENAAAIVAALLVVADELENVSISVAEK